MVHKIEIVFKVLSPRFSQHGVLPEQIVQTKSLIAARRSPRVPTGRQANPDHLQIRIRVNFQIALDVGLELWISHDPNLMRARKMPREVPRKTRFRAAIGTTRMTDKQYLH